MRNIFIIVLLGLLIGKQTYLFGKMLESNPYFLEESKPDTIGVDTSLISRKSPIGAVVRSLILPGWGQIYVHKYWKAPLFFAGAITMYYYTFKHNSNYLNYSRQYDDLFKQNPNDPSLNILKLKRENSRDNRDISIFFLCGIYALSMLDAYVDAHLYNFNVSETFSLYISPNFNGFNVTISFLLLQ